MKKIDLADPDRKEAILRDDRLNMTPAQWRNLIKRLGEFYTKVEEAEAKPSARRKEPECYDEQIWTFLVACGYAYAEHEGKNGLQRLAALLSGIEDIQTSPVWMAVSSGGGSPLRIWSNTVSR